MRVYDGTKLRLYGCTQPSFIIGGVLYSSGYSLTIVAYMKRRQPFPTTSSYLKSALDL